MSYDASTIAMLRTVLDELLVSEAFTRQGDFAAVDAAQCVLKLASQGERDALNIKRYVSSKLVAEAAA